MILDSSPEPAREMVMLEQIEHDPDVNQSDLATQLGIAVGTVNWHLKRMVAKGYVKVKRANRRKLRYIITPEGIAFRARLTIDYVEQSMLLYRATRQHVRELLSEVIHLGYDRVRVDADSTNGQANDIADVCRLTCLEQGIRVSTEENLPALLVRGVKVSLRLEENS